MQKPLEIVPAKKAEYVRTRTDKYFTKSREIVEKFGDKTVTYGVFMRRRVICAINPAIECLREYYPADATPLKITRLYEEGAFVPDGKPLFAYTGSFAGLLELETLILQRVGVACVVGVQREPDGDEPAEDGVHRHARAPRDRRRHDPARGVRRLGRQPDGEARRRGRVRRHVAGPHRALLRRRARAPAPCRTR